MKKLLPVILALLGLAAGTAAGIFLKPPQEIPDAGHDTLTTANEDPEHAAHRPGPSSEDEAPVRRSEQDGQGQDAAFDYVKLNNQFVVPVVKDTKVTALVVMSLSVEVEIGQKEEVFSREPKLRDTFLQVLFDHANSGGFDGTFTTGEKMNDLRGSLYQAAVRILGSIATDVLVIDIVRQDI